MSKKAEKTTMCVEYNPLVKIVKRERYRPSSAPRGAGAVMLTLACGHEVHRKQSQEPKTHARCPGCARGVWDAGEKKLRGGEGGAYP